MTAQARSRRWRRCGLTAGAALAVVLLSGCTDEPVLGDGGELLGGATSAQPVLASAQYAASVDAAEQRARVERLSDVVEQLRADSPGGWQVRQDDVTGWAAELSGGRWTAQADATGAVRAFLDGYGSAFGLRSTDDVSGPAQVGYDEAGVADVRLQQTHGGVPVEGGELLVPVRSTGGLAEVSLARGRIFDVASAATSPTVSAETAAATVEALAGAPVTEVPVLVVLGDLSSPRLTWRTTVTPARDASAAGDVGLDGPSRVYVDALDGRVVEARSLDRVWAQSAGDEQPELGLYDFELPPPGKPVKARGTLPDGTQVEVNAEQQPDGSIVMVDATGPQADRATKKGLIVLFEGRGLTKDSGGIGQVLRLPSTDITDSDAVMAMWSARTVMDYYAQKLGRLSFDGRNSPLVTVVRFTDGEECRQNASFVTAPGGSRMLLGVPCVSNGTPESRTLAGLGTVAHEVTHGVTHTNALEFAGANLQQTAIDEGVSDYFGVVIENLATRTVKTTRSHFACADGLTSETYCRPLTNGQHGIRDVNTGATFDDLLFNLDDPRSITDFYGDDGHANSMVWTNALWKIRSSLAQRDGGDHLSSPRAEAFDRAVYRATTTYLDQSSDLVSAAEAVVRAMGEVEGLDGDARTVATRQFGQSKLCRSCGFPPQINRPVAASSRTKTRPVVTSAGVAFTQHDGSISSRALLGQPGQAQVTALDDGKGWVTALAGKGDAVVSTVVTFRDDGNGTSQLVLRDVRSGASTTLSGSVPVWVAAATDGRTVAWMEGDARGQPSVLKAQPVAGGQAVVQRVSKEVAHLAVSGERLAILYGDGELAVRDLAGGDERVLGRVGPMLHPTLSKPLGGLAFDGNRVAVLEDPVGDEVGRTTVVVFDVTTGAATRLSESASPFGVALDGDLVVWPEVIGTVGGQIAEYSPLVVPDTELRGYSFATGTYYRVAGQRGQQGFPSLDDRVLAWQDAVAGSNDIFATTLPEGL